MEAVETPSLFTPSPNSEGSHRTCTLRITYDLTLLRPYPRKLSQSTEKAVSQRPREGWVSGWVSGWHGYLLSALGRLALALVVQDALDQMVVLIQHLKGREAHASHTAAGSHPGRQDPWGVCWGHSLQVPGPYLQSATDPHITTAQEAAYISVGYVQPGPARKPRGHRG